MTQRIRVTASRYLRAQLAEIRAASEAEMHGHRSYWVLLKSTLQATYNPAMAFRPKAFLETKEYPLKGFLRYRFGNEGRLLAVASGDQADLRLLCVLRKGPGIRPGAYERFHELLLAGEFRADLEDMGRCWPPLDVVSRTIRSAGADLDLAGVPSLAAEASRGDAQGLGSELAAADRLRVQAPEGDREGGRRSKAADGQAEGGRRKVR